MNQPVNKSRAQMGGASDATAQTVTPIRPIDAGSTTRAAIQTWTGKVIREQIHAKPLADAYRQWLFHRASRRPRLRDMYTQSMSAFDDMLLNVKIGKEHIVVSQSESFIRNLGRDLRGTLSSELKFATANSLRDIYDDCLAREQPIYARYISSLSEYNVYWEVLVVPLSTDGASEPIFTMSCTSMLSEKIDILQILYDRSPVGIVAAVPIMNGQNKTDDARILTMNGKARQIFKQDPSRGQFHTVGELIHFVGSSLNWSGTKTSVEGHATRIDYRNPAGEQFSMTIELINQLVLISVAERGLPDTRATNMFARLLGLA